MRIVRKTHKLIASHVSCACCASPFNALFGHGPADARGQLLAIKYQVVCDDCRASGPLCETAKLALEGWEMMNKPARDELRRAQEERARDAQHEQEEPLRALP